MSFLKNSIVKKPYKALPLWNNETNMGLVRRKWVRSGSPRTRMVPNLNIPTREFFKISGSYRPSMQYFRMKSFRWNLSKGTRGTMGTALCQRPRLDRIIPGSNDQSCWHPGSEKYDPVVYKGNMNTTISGNPCLPWPRHKICDNYKCDNHNYCRKYPGYSGYWCYKEMTSKDLSNFEICSIPKCGETVPTTATTTTITTTITTTTTIATTTTMTPFFRWV